MKIKVFKTLWGHQGTTRNAVQRALQASFNGIEGQVPEAKDQIADFKNQLADTGLDYIAEITTAGSYVPDRRASLQQHLQDFERKLEASLKADPLFITCLGGCDAWPESQTVEFLIGAMEIAEAADIAVSFETHRSRSLFNPWVTDRVVREIPDLKLTCDYSHWCVVCERLMDTELDVLERLSKHAFHIHARVGYEQGPQVPHPAAPEYEYALRAHQLWWEMIWQEQRSAGYQETTITPEFGPDGYLHRLPFSNKPVADLWELNCWMATEERQHFERWSRVS